MKTIIIKYKTKAVLEKETKEIIRQNVMASKSKVILRKALR